MCRVLEVSRSGYYAASLRPPSLHSNMDIALREVIVHRHSGHGQIPGAVKLWQELNQDGIACGKHRIARLRKLEGIAARRTQRYRVMHTHQHTEPPAPDLVQRAFTVAAPNKIWVGDITSIRTREGWLHLSIVLDLYARRIVGWAMDQTQTASLPIAALSMAIAQRSPGKNLICHTDQGSVYGSTAYRKVLTEHTLLPSMSRRGNCHDNAVAESFFSNLKNELTHYTTYDTRAEAQTAIADYIEVYYNRKRLHQTLGYSTPARAEALYHAKRQHEANVLNLTVH